MSKYSSEAFIFRIQKEKKTPFLFIPKISMIAIQRVEDEIIKYIRVMYNVYIITTSNDALMENTKQIRMLEITKRVITLKNICEMLYTQS